MKISSSLVRSLVVASGLMALQVAGCIRIERKAPTDVDAIADGDAGADDLGDLSADVDLELPPADGVDAVDAPDAPDAVEAVDAVDAVDSDALPDAGNDGDGAGDAADPGGDAETTLDSEGDGDGVADGDTGPDGDTGVDGQTDAASDTAETDAAPNCDPFDLTACNDENPCTQDRCDSALGCLHVPDNTLPCDDGTPCTVGDKCLSGGCVGGAAPDCADDNPCTDDGCEEATGECRHAPTSGADCDFDGPCAEVTGVCEDGTCAGIPVTCPASLDACKPNVCQPGSDCVAKSLNGTSCDDGDPCTSVDTCVAGTCKGTKASCDDGNPCTIDLCDALTGGCTHAPDSGASCAAAAGCEGAGICEEDTCVATSACECSGDGECDDGNECTTGTCVSGSCEYQDVAGACDDDDACTFDDECAAGACVGGSEESCDDENECTTDACNPASGCDYSVNAGPCDDEDACTVGESCQATLDDDVAACGGGSARSCDDGDPCTIDSCNQAVGCLQEADSDACTSASADECKMTLCQPTAGSAQTCAQLGWKSGLGSADVCGQSEVPACSGLKTFAQARGLCEAAGARLCTWTELTGNEAAQTGCSYDTERVWTSTACGTNAAMTQAGGSSGFGAVMSQCTPKAGTAYVRCCADVNANTELPMCTTTVKPGRCDDGDACTLNDRCQPTGCVGDPVDCSGLNSACTSGACVGGQCEKSILSGTSCSTTDTCIVSPTCDASGVCTGSYDGQKPGCSCKAELCPGVGSECTQTDIGEGCKTFFKDSDGDGHGDPKDSACACATADKYTASAGDDCDDTQSAAWSGAAERCDGIDNNCNGQTDETFTQLGKACDGDDADSCANGVVKCAASGTGTMCVEPAANIAEACNGQDDDCDGETDEGFVTATGLPVGAACDGADSDKCFDDVVVCEGGAAVCSLSSDTPEVCGNGIDEDCDGLTDEEGAVGCKLFYQDIDGDGVGKSGLCLCAKTGFYTAQISNDCDDTDGDVFPGQAAYFGVARADPGLQPAFDYDCDGAETKQYGLKGNEAIVGCAKGWANSIPECGQTGTYVTKCSVGLFPDTDKGRVQGCR